MFEKIGNEGWSGNKTHKWLHKIGFETRNGKKLSLANVYLILRSHFYYGEFEYPVGSGNWYCKGPHLLDSERTFF